MNKKLKIAKQAFIICLLLGVTAQAWRGICLNLWGLTKGVIKMYDANSSYKAFKKSNLKMEAELKKIQAQTKQKNSTQIDVN
ncbi:MAG TPA: hypothetical protein V6C96_02495 [Vampirovibrionales bacterium]